MASLACACSTAPAAARLSSRNGSMTGSRALVARPMTQNIASRGTLQVVAGKGKGKQMYRSRGSGGPQREMPPTPPVDPTNEEFVLFVRSTKLPQWIPLSVVKGGTAANMLVKSMNGSFAQSTFKDTLIRNIGEVVYKDRESIESMLKEQFPPMKNATSFEYGFKIRDKTKPDNWYLTENIMKIPAEGDLPKPPIKDVQDKASNFFKKLGGGSS